MSVIQYDQWRDNFLATDVFNFTSDQFHSLRQANFASACISLVSSFAIFVAYTFMFIRHRKEANRVSLRCVFLCALSDMLNAAMNIVSINISGESTFCKAATILIDFSTIWNATLLTLVGVNLVLIFVINVKRRDLLERFYYPSVLVYSLIGESVSIHTEIVSEPEINAGYSCWYQVYIADRTIDPFSWMWFYGCIFLVNVLAVFCSVIAMNKLLREQKVLAKKLDNIALSSSFGNTDTEEQQSHSSAKRKKNSVFSTVVVRCILYPLVPFIVNIFGFIMQMIITTDNNHPPGFALCMLDVISTNIGGFYVAIIFFTDPAMTTVMKSGYADWREKYIQEYTLVSKEDFKKYTEGSQKNTIDNSVDSNVPAENMNPPSVQSPSPAIITQSNPFSSNPKTDVYNNIYKANRHQEEGALYIHQKNKDQLTVPMRRLVIKTPESNRRDNRSRASYMSGSFSSSTPAPSRSSQALEFQNTTIENKEIYVPYRYPRLATCAHYILELLGERKRLPSAPVVTSKKNVTSTKTTYESAYMTDEEEDIIIPYKTDTTDVITPIKEDDYTIRSYSEDTDSSGSRNSKTRYI